MAISVKDIQEKEFSTQAVDGYNAEQVDDFLDAIAEQMSTLIRENLALGGQVKQLEESVKAAETAKTELEQKLPDYNENGYFRNLESAMRESLIGAQRIADETVTEAQKKAQQATDSANASAEKTISEANALAEKTVTEAKAEAEKTLSDANDRAKLITDEADKAVSELKAEAAQLRQFADSYRASFQKLLDDQLAALKESQEALK